MLVIIGLLVGGVMVGRDLIKAADIRATISQKERFDAAANAFKLKYDCLPGDCAKASQFGLGSGTTHPAFLDGSGNGEGIVCNPNMPNTNIVTATGNYNTQGSTECLNFWHHLNSAGLLNDSFVGISDPTSCFLPGFHSPAPPVAQRYDTGSYCGSASTKRIGGWAVLDAQTSPYISVGAAGAAFSPIPFIGRSYLITATRNLQNSGNGVVSDNDMRAIDQKIDDGLPLTGNVFVIRSNFIDSGGNQPTFSVAFYSTNAYDNSDIPHSIRNLVLKAGF